MLLAVATYFLLSCCALALALLPPARGWATALAQRRWAGSRDALTGLWTATRRRARRIDAAVGGAAIRGARRVHVRRRQIGLALTVLATPSLLAWAMRHAQELDTFDHTASRSVNAQVATLLQGEQLVPPPALPPELFTVPEVERARPLIRDASREWALLDTEFRQRLLVVFRVMQERHGYELVLLEGYRSPERQARLAALGRQVTLAGPNQSYHQFGLAADIAFRRDGRVVIRETDPWAMRGYELYGQYAASVGLSWGGEWSRLKDYGHTELRRPGGLRPGVADTPVASARADLSRSPSETIPCPDPSS